MPEYLYRDRRGHERWVFQRMLYSTATMCDCGLLMQRVPLPVAVNWGGMRPSRGELHPKIRRLIETAPERRDAFARRHEEHERAS